MKPLSVLMGVLTGAMMTTLGLSNVATAAELSLRGTFTQDDDVQLFDFVVDTESTVTVRTYSYGGGVQADGTVIAAGGFDPVLSLFDGTGNFLALSDDGPVDILAADPQTGQRYDALLDRVLAAGYYTLALTQYANFPVGHTLADGFSASGNGNFTSEFEQCTTESPFCDFTGDLRTNEWAFDTSGLRFFSEADADILPSVEPDAAPKSVPEPTATVAIALAGMLAMKKRRRNK